LKVYKDKDANLKILKNKNIAILGYGSQGRAQALNLKDSGLNVIIGLPLKSKSRRTAIKDGFEVFKTEEAVRFADIISVLIPDHLHKEAYKKEIAKNLSSGKALIFAHGFSIHFKLILPPKKTDVILVAPHGPGILVRELFQKGKGVPCFLAVDQNYSGKAKQLGLAYAKGMGATKVGVIETTFKDEALGDLFGEQVVLCGGVSELLKKGFEILVEKGLSPENAYLECVHQLDNIVALIKNYGIAGMYSRISKTAEFGSYLSGKRVINQETKQRMREIFEEIKNGGFTKKWIREYESGMKNYWKLKKEFYIHPLEKASKKIRNLVK
jgi:ketol-acid reductoisomerase